MAFDLNNTIALVTGGTGKLARHIVLRLARAGADIALHYHRQESLARELKAAVEGFGRRCGLYSFDLADPQAATALTRAVLADFGHVDILVNAAGVFGFRRLAETDDAFWRTMLDLNVTAVFRLVRALEPEFRRHPSAVLNLADIWGLRPKAAFLAYSVSKAALVALTKALAEELAPTTTVNAIAPGLIDFPPDLAEAKRQAALQRIPVQRTGRPEEVADLAVHILTNRYITGQILAVDGGRMLRS